MGLPAEKESREGGLAGGAAERAGKHKADKVSGDGECGDD